MFVDDSQVVFLDLPKHDRNDAGAIEFGGLYQQRQESFRNLTLDFVGQLRAEGASLEEALVHSGYRRLRPVRMTSLAAAFGMLPLAYGIGEGADMLRSFAIAVIGALCMAVLLSLVATPTVYYLLLRLAGTEPGKSCS